MPINSFDDYPMSWKPDIEKCMGPLYKTIAQQLENDVREGVLTPGTRLPPQRELADFLDINVSTVSRAFKLCEQKGIICSTVGNGTFVASDAAADPFLLSEKNLSDIIEMGPVFPSKNSNGIIAAQMEKMIAKPDFPELFQYGRINGTLWQKDTAAKLIRRAGYDVKSSQVLLANGAQNAIIAVLAGLFRAGDVIGTCEFTYPGIKTAANMLGIRLYPIPSCDDEEITAENLLYACKNGNIKGVYIIPDMHNPTTHTLSETSRNAIADIARREHLIVIEDAIHSLLYDTPRIPIAARVPERTIYISSLSKVISPGLRMAFLAVPESCRQKLTEALYNMNISVPPMMAELVCRMIVSGDARKIIEEHRNENRQRNTIVDRYLKNYDVRGVPEGIMRWLILPSHITGESFAASAYQRGVHVYGAECFAVGNAKSVNAVRLAVAAPGTHEQLADGVQLIKKMLDERCAGY